MKHIPQEIMDALGAIASMEGMSLLGPDSLHNGPTGPRYHEMGANAAFNQAAQLALEAIEWAQQPCFRCGQMRGEHDSCPSFQEEA